MPNPPVRSATAEQAGRKKASVLPDLIGDFKHNEIDDCKSLKMGDMIPTLVKAIQELSAKVEALENA